MEGEEASEVECKSENEIRKYLENKTIVVFATESFVKEDTNAETNKNELVSFMVPIAEKRLDFKYHKEIIVQVEELMVEI